MLKFVVKLVVFTENQHLVGFSPIMKVSFHMLWFQDISFWNWSFKDYHYKKNNYPLNFMDLHVKSFLNKLYTPKVLVPNVPKRNVFVKLPFLGSTSFQIQKKLQKLFSDKLTSCYLKIVFMSTVWAKSFLESKAKLPMMLLSGLVYE